MYKVGDQINFTTYSRDLGDGVRRAVYPRAIISGVVWRATLLEDEGPDGWALCHCAGTWATGNSVVKRLKVSGCLP